MLVLFFLLSQCAVQGTVAGPDGVPVPGAAVTAAGRAGAVANERGQYCIPELPAGEYVFRAHARRVPPSASPDCEECCEPATDYASGSTAASVRYGGAAVADIRLHRVPVYCVAGEIRGARAATVGVSIEAEGWSASVINERGRFLLTALPAGSYSVVVSDRPQLGRILARRKFRVTGPRTEPLIITLQ